MNRLFLKGKKMTKKGLLTLTVAGGVAAVVTGVYFLKQYQSLKKLFHQYLKSDFNAKLTTYSQKKQMILARRALQNQKQRES